MVEVDKKRFELTIATCYFKGMDLLITDGLYESQEEIVKDALRRLFVHYEISMVTEDTVKN